MTREDVRPRLAMCAGLMSMLAIATAAGAQQVAQAKGKPAPAAPAVTAEFRSAAPYCYTGDTVAGDGDTVSCVSRVYPPSDGAEGAFINTNGGLTIALKPNYLSPERTMWFDFSGAGNTLQQDYGTCGRPFTTLASADVTLAVNALDAAGTSLVGLQAVPVGASRIGSGTINFSSGLSGDPYSFWTLRPQKQLKITHLSTGPDQWTIEWYQWDTTVFALLQCTKTGKGKTVILDDSLWVMPFKITVTAVQ